MSQSSRSLSKQIHGHPSYLKKKTKKKNMYDSFGKHNLETNHNWYFKDFKMLV